MLFFKNYPYQKSDLNSFPDTLASLENTFQLEMNGCILRGSNLLKSNYVIFVNKVQTLLFNFKNYFFYSKNTLFYRLLQLSLV